MREIRAVATRHGPHFEPCGRKETAHAVRKTLPAIYPLTTLAPQSYRGETSPMTETRDASPPEPPQKERGLLRGFPFLSPLSGALVLAVDSAFFGAEAITGGLAIPFASAAAFFISFAGVYAIQRNRERNTRRSSLVKALVCGLVAGIPTSISGTALGTLVLLASGLRRH